MVAPARGNRGSADFLRIPGPHLALSIVEVLFLFLLFFAFRGVGVERARFSRGSILRAFFD